MVQAPTTQQFQASRTFYRQDIINSIVMLRGIQAGAELNVNGLDFDIADCLNQLGYKIIQDTEFLKIKDR